MRLSKLSIQKLKKYVDFLHQFDCDIIINFGGNQTAFLVDIDSVPNNSADSIEVYNYIHSETVQTYYSVNAFLIYFSVLRSNSSLIKLFNPIFDCCDFKNISVKSLN